MSELYNRIAMLCKQRGISVGKMCNQLGISRGNLTELKMERIKTLKINNLTKIANFFNVSVDYLLGNEEKPVVEEDNELNEMLEDIRRNPELRAMFSIIRKSTPEQVRQYTDVIKAIKGEK